VAQLFSTDCEFYLFEGLGKNSLVAMKSMKVDGAKGLRHPVWVMGQPSNGRSPWAKARPFNSRLDDGSRMRGDVPVTVLRAPGGAIPPGDSPAVGCLCVCYHSIRGSFPPNNETQLFFNL
jgi:hypothetical protein